MLPDPSDAGRLEQLLRVACGELARRLWAGEACRAEAMFARFPALASEADCALELIYSTEYLIRCERGERPSFEEYYQRFPQWRGPLERQFQVHALLDPEGVDLSPPGTTANGPDAEQGRP